MQKTLKFKRKFHYYESACGTYTIEKRENRWKLYIKTDYRPARETRTLRAAKNWAIAHANGMDTISTIIATCSE